MNKISTNPVNLQQGRRTCISDFRYFADNVLLWSTEMVFRKLPNSNDSKPASTNVPGRRISQN